MLERFAFVFQYKDAFFTANPDFKWYKLPAPPLRTLSSRPRESHDKQPVTPSHDYEPELEKTNNNSTKLDLNKKPVPHEDGDRPLSMFTPGKLADEAHMGGLSSLLATKTEPQTPNPYYSPPAYKYNQISLQQPVPRIKSSSDNIAELQNALSETTRVFEDFEDGERKVYYNDQFTNQDVIDQIVDKRYSKDDEFDYGQRNWAEYEQNSKSGRTCKGKRYQEFMAYGGLLVTKRQKRDSNTDDYFNASCSWEHGNSRSEGSTVSDEMKPDSLDIDSPTKFESMDTIDSPDHNNGKNSFKAADFDLDSKIKALPSLSLDKFQQRKRDNKRKKKMINLKPKVERNTTPLIINSVPRPAGLDERREMAEKWRENVIGSQKRKPRKISITRLEINSLAPSVDLNKAFKISPEIKIATEAPCTVVGNMDMRAEPAHSNDLFALATLAEVAANTSKIEESAIFTNMATKANDNASKV